MIIVAGHLRVEASRRSAFLDSTRHAVAAARKASGCLDYAVSEDPLEPERVNVFERWTSAEAVEAFRGNGPSGDEWDAVIKANVQQYDVGGARSLT